MNVVMFPTMLFLIIGVIFLVVLFIRLSKNNPKLTKTLLLVALIPVLSIFLLRISYHRRLAPVTRVAQYTTNNGVRQIAQYRDNYSHSTVVIPHSANQAPIWSEGIEDQFEADVYPSGSSALRALAPRVEKQIPYVMGESGSPETIVIYSDSIGIENAEEFRQAISKLVPEIKCRIEISNDVGINQKEVGLHFTLMDSRNGKVDAQHLVNDGESSIIQARLFSGDRILDTKINYSNKYWVEDFSSFVNRHPDKQYVIAKSNETSIAPEEADKQAMQNACYQVDQLAPNLHNISSKDILDSDIVVDKFVQSFNGSQGKIWRQAVLLDVSGQKLNRLAAIISGAARVRSMTWARMVFSIIGLFVLITIVYAFLNAATRGYYAWSLRIVGVILAAIFLMIILTLS